jgi:NADPH2:quinone reductase
LNLLLLKQAALVGVFWGAFARARPEQNAQNFADLFAWYAEGRLHPHVSQTFTLERYREALDAVMSRRAQGKVALVVA